MIEQASAKLIFRDNVFDVPAGRKIRRAVKDCGISPESVLPVRDGELVMDNEILRDGDEITLIAVISGG